jgi:predicted ATPase/DNA-binding winged helix-turn-helix (wHTH) protein
MPDPAPLRFDCFTLELDNERLLRDGEPVGLTPKAFALLALLAQRAGRLVLKDELLDTVWGRRFVSEGTVKSLLAELRAAMGDDARAPRWVETVPRRGLRFIGQLRPVPPADSEVDATGPVPAAPLVLRPAGSNPLPVAPSPPIARELELSQLAMLLQAQRLVTLIGPAGVGKTRLALAVATAWPAGEPVWWIELAPLARADADAATLRAMLVSGLRLAPAAAASDDALAAALPALGGLLLLDNAEHVLDALAPLVARLHRHAPRLRWLLTSREPLNVAAEQVFRLAPMPVPQPADDAELPRVLAAGAVQLFVARVAARLPGFALTEAQAAAAARVCRALDGLPLALEMAAARVPVLGVGGLDEQLRGAGVDADEPGGRLALLTQGLRDLAPHQRTLRASLNWGHALLTADEQRVFRRLAVFSGGFTLGAAVIVCADLLAPGEVLDALHALVDKSLLGTASNAGAGPSGAPRFSLLESVREFAAEQLKAEGEADAAARAQLSATGDYWRRADDEALDVPAMAWLERHALELGNLRAALRWAQRAVAPADGGDAPPGHEGDQAPATCQPIATELLALIGHAHLLWTRHGLPREGRHWCEVAASVVAAMPEPPADLLLANIDLLRADLSFIYRMLPIEEGLAAAERAAGTLARAGDARHEFHARALAASLKTESGRAAEGDAHIERMRALVKPGWGELRLRYLRVAEAAAARRRGDLATFRAIAQQELLLCRRLQAAGESWTAAHLVCVAEGLHGRADLALAATTQAVAEICAAGRQQQYGQLLSMHALLTAEHRPTGEARRVLTLTLPALAQMGAAEVQWLALAWLAWHEQRPEDAAAVIGWFESPTHGAASRFGPETLVGQTRLRLIELVEAALGAHRATAGRLAGHGLGFERALAAAWGER